MSQEFPGAPFSEEAFFRRKLAQLLSGLVGAEEMTTDFLERIEAGNLAKELFEQNSLSKLTETLRSSSKEIRSFLGIEEVEETAVDLLKNQLRNQRTLAELLKILEVAEKEIVESLKASGDYVEYRLRSGISVLLEWDSGWKGVKATFLENSHEFEFGDRFLVKIFRKSGKLRRMMHGCDNVFEMELHREDGPADEWYRKDGRLKIADYYLHGDLRQKELYRKNGTIKARGHYDGEATCEYLHREDGFAVERFDEAGEIDPEQSENWLEGVKQ